MTDGSKKYTIRIKYDDKLSEKDKIEEITQKLKQIQLIFDENKRGKSLDTAKMDQYIAEIKTYNLVVGLPQNAADIIKEYKDKPNEIEAYFENELSQLKEKDQIRTACFTQLYDLL